MLSYLQKFNDLPKDIKSAVSSPEIAANIIELGHEYKVDLAATVMKVIVKEIKLEGLAAYLVNQFSLSLEQARLIDKELRKSVFSSVLDYLLGASAGPKLVFSETDEKEVKQIAQPVSTSEFDSKIEAAVQKIVEKSRISLTDPLVSSKFRQVIKTYLRLTRDRSSTLEALIKSSELGGVALSREAADRALASADFELNNFKKVASPAPTKITVPEDKTPIKSPLTKVTQVADYDLATSLKAAGKLKETEPVMMPEHELAPPVPVISQEVKAKPASQVSPTTKKIIKEALVNNKPIDKGGLRKIVDQVAKPEPVVNLKVATSGKIKMDDIHFTPRVLNPVDELRYMTVKNFRRLDPDPIKATEKIKAKLELLGEEDYSKKIDGIVAWKESALNKLYLSLCRRALDLGQPIIDVLKQELKNEPDSLKPEELSAIIALNHLLKF